MNPVIMLGELCQKRFGASIVTEVTGKQGPDHMPTVHVRITLPNGKEYTASGSNQKIAKQIAADNALSDLLTR